ncbi:Transcription initiation factor TFIID subunit 8 [Oopsacas minuta]|uniref:Transcription initiation factor TFIID subunit 8 n=1 Tax=Oopsacas minuta TaxID=111878 RepID=A0AAV7JCG6_9METZ|nr:Transcription initiation factor TFIID subunit 8 [Oopsacas minuta]
MTDPNFAALSACSAAICSTSGFSKIRPTALSLLTNHLQSYIIEIGEASKNLSEHARRTNPTLQDVILALKKLGIDFTTLVSIPNSSSHTPVCKQVLPNPIPRPLSVGVKQSQPPSIPSHLPSFPDPHTYLSTPAQSKDPPSYKEQRAKMAEQRRLGAESLIRYFARTGQVCPVLGTEIEDDENLENLFFLTATPHTQPAYLSALLSKRYITAGVINRTKGDGNIDSNPFLKPAKRIKLRISL